MLFTIVFVELSEILNQHSHQHSEVKTRQTGIRLGLSLFLTIALVVGEFVVGTYANSLAILTDAAHNLTDVAALGLSWYAHRLSAQPAHAGKTFGYHRVGILAALVNSSSLVLIAAGIIHEAYQRFSAPAEVLANMMILAGGAAFIVNLLTAWLVGHGSHDDLNLRSAFLHLMGDVFSSLGAMLAGIAIRLTGITWLDPLVSILIAMLILWNAWLILRETVDILLESSPKDIEMSTMVRDILQIKGIRGVHDLHVWSISRQYRMLTAHLVLDDMLISQTSEIQVKVEVLLGENYGISHSTLQIECERCLPDRLYCHIHPAVNGFHDDHDHHDHNH